MYGVKLISVSDPIEIDLQLLATELDTAANKLYIISDENLNDAVALQLFNGLLDEVLSEGELVVSLDENADLYEFDQANVIYYHTIHRRAIIFDKEHRYLFENRLTEHRSAYQL